jgi:FAD/FMN-containing dehydrogenase
VVKNVTGYDLAKLYAGSLGTLAVIAEISLKVRARFGATATAVAEFDKAADALAVLEALRKSPLIPVACEFVGPRPALWIRFGDDPKAVAWQISNLPRAPWVAFEGEGERAQWEALRQRRHAMGPVVLRAVGTPSSIGEMLELYRPASWIAHAATGVVLMSLENSDEVRRIRARFPAIVERAPDGMRAEMPAFGVTGAELKIMKAMKRALDPEGRLNPGRHVDGE